MRVVPVLLIAIGVWGLFYPQTLLAEDSGGGRWLFAVIIFLGALSIWRAVRRSKS